MSETRTGVCRFCNQSRLVDEDALLDAVRNGVAAEEAADYCASNECDCKGAQIERERRMKLEAAGEYVQNVFGEDDAMLHVALCSIQATFGGSADKVTIKKGKRTYVFDRDKDGMIRIKSTYKDTDEETF